MTEPDLLMPHPDHVCAGERVPVGGAHLYYERAGQGPPCLLLHGGFLSHCSWDAVAASLREDFDVIALDSRGQGRSEDGAGPITYGRMASDVVGVMDALGLERAHVVGHSDGGCVGVHLLIDHPDRLDSATLIGTPLHLSDYREGIHAGLVAYTSALAAGTGEDPFGFEEHYRRLSSQPDRWPLVARKLAATWRTQPTFSDDALRQVEVPVLVVGGGRDEFLDRRVFERTADLFPNGRLAWIEEGTHAVPMTHGREVASLVRAFAGDGPQRR